MSTATSTTSPPSASSEPTRPTGRWIEQWDPEDAVFWQATGRRVARRNLVFSIVAEHLGFSVWVLWSAGAALLARAGFGFTPQQLFWLVAMPNLVGSLLRLPYTFAVPRFGGRNWTVVSALLLVVPTVLFAVVVQRPGTPYWVFLVVAAVAGVGGGNFASSMASINHFFPTAQKGSALGLNAAGGNAGVAVIQFFLPVVVGAAGAFGLVKGAQAVHLERVGYLYAALAVLAAGCAYLFMDNLRAAYSRPREQLRVVRHRHTWVMAFLYVGTFGSFIGYSSAMPLLIKLNFWAQPFPAVPGIGVNFAYYAFLGALVGSVARPLGGWLADRLGGARVTVAGFTAMVLGTIGVLVTLHHLRAVPKAAGPLPRTAPAGWDYPAPVRAAVDHNTALFPWFLAAFLFVFAATGVANGSTYRMIPAIFRDPRESSAVLGLVGAVGALGGFLIPITFGAPWIDDPVSAVRSAFVVFTAFYVVCLVVTWAVYLRPGSALARARV